MKNHEIIEKLKAGTLTAEDLDKFESRLCQRAVEEALRTVPSVVDHVTKQAFFLRKMSSKFYEEHPELAEHKELVTKTIEELEGSNPGLSFESLVAKAGVETKKKLKDMKKLTPDVDLDPPKRKQMDSKLGEI